jgi:hypothetical protein
MLSQYAFFGILLFLLNIGADVNSLSLVRKTEFLEGNGGLDAIRRGPGVERDVRRHCGIRRKCR